MGGMRGKPSKRRKSCDCDCLECRIAKALDVYEPGPIAKITLAVLFIGGCDHSVGICECADRMDYERLDNLIKVLEGRLAI